MADFRANMGKNYVFYLYGSVSGSCGNGAVLGGFGSSQVCPAAPLATNSWTHLTLTYDGATLALYRNGAWAASVPASGAVAQTGGTLQIGASQFGEYFPGAIDEA